MSISPITRTSLPQETYRILKQGIEAGQWKHYLPGERALASQLQVSRPTLRLALQRLQEDRLISGDQGCRREILQDFGREKPRRKQLVVGLLCPGPIRKMPGHTARKVGAIEHHLHANQIQFEVHDRSRCFNKRPAKLLKELTDESHVDAWILQEAGREMQEWFYSQQIPTVVSGTPFEGIPLPSVDLGNKAICRHAVGLLASRGRRNIIMVAKETPLPGDILSEEGFAEGIQASSGVEGKVLRWKGSSERLCAQLTTRMHSDSPPDAFLADQTGFAFTVYSFLLRNGYQIPRDVSLLCRCQSHEFDSLTPSIACYSRATEICAKRTAEMVIKVLNRQPLQKERLEIIPEFLPGESLGTGRAE